MAKRIVWAPQAVADRIQILDYWYKRLGTKTYAQRLDRMFKASVRLLCNFPFLGRKIENREERVLVRDHFLIVHRVDGETLQILHLWDSRRDPEALEL